MEAGGVKENQEGERRKLPKLKNPAKLWKNRKQRKHTDTADPQRTSERTPSAGGVKENQEGERRKLPKLKNPAKFWKNRKQRPHINNADELDCEEVPEQQQEEEKGQLEEESSRLIIREEQLFSQDSRSEEEEDQLQKDFEALNLQMWMAVHSTFNTSTTSSSSSEHLKVLRSAVASIQQQEEQDRRWAGCPEERVPVWRPQKCLSTHNTLLQNMVVSRLMKAAEEDCGEANRLSSPLKKEVCRMGKRVKEDLLTVVRTVQDCYPPQMDILNVYSGLFHQSFSARLTELAASELEQDDCSYLLFWINQYYPHEILNHEELKGKVKTACLGSLLLQDHLNRLEDQFLTHKEENVKLWLNTALTKEEESWLSGQKPELIDQCYFSPLAIDVIQLMNKPLTEFSCAITEQGKAHRITAHLESFFCSYKKCLEEFVKGNHNNAGSVIKAHLVCEQQFRVYITSETGSLSEQQRRRCLETLSALKDCGYRYFTCPIQIQLKVYFTQLWTSVWLDGSLPVVDSLLDSLNEQLTDLTDLKPACRQSLLCVLHQNLALQYVKRTMKTRARSSEQQVGGAQRMTEDARTINDFFNERGCSESLWLGEMLCSVAEVLRLQDPGSVQLEVVNLARTFPDFSDAHVSALLSLKTGLSAADVRSIRRSVEENRHLDVTTNESHPFFSKVKVKWINKFHFHIVRWPPARWPPVRCPPARCPTVRWPPARWPLARCPTVRCHQPAEQQSTAHRPAAHQPPAQQSAISIIFCNQCSTKTEPAQEPASCQLAS
ncbi:tumor necrosis factor alpha-induced protein 2-like isoform X3 [Sebastes umbrosus]|uniref:tumor necrosis factor alpha-induced protein 2-like isoform X3 n=1 Tax=Sebastes umbrosus TaxID=72105 RepID=UPI0018A01E2A|nr:tumor necrosis factor alpha-induced protein 2-like isoform X3 [Sebastes umbrosus]